MVLTKEEIQTVKRIVGNNIQKYISGKPYVLDITYAELYEEIVKIREKIPDIPTVRIE